MYFTEGGRAEIRSALKGPVRLVDSLERKMATTLLYFPLEQSWRKSCLVLPWNSFVWGRNVSD